mmetsp:Transcript_19905/g.22548  ORF Transcript_19905/g.22548 Transcript_19905/m.22548 type:complete len:91 (+) Transcript_19905:542-814(+)
MKCLFIHADWVVVVFDFLFLSFFLSLSLRDFFYKEMSLRGREIKGDYSVLTFSPQKSRQFSLKKLKGNLVSLFDICESDSRFPNKTYIHN